MAKFYTASRSVEKLKLLSGIKTCVERVLSLQPTNIWGDYEGLETVVESIDVIMKYGLKESGILGSSHDYWPFVKSLRWLDTTLAPRIKYLSAMPSSPRNLHQKINHNIRDSENRGKQWIETSLKDGELFRHLKLLMSDKKLVVAYYHEWAFLTDADFSFALLICIQALEDNSSKVLEEIPSEISELGQQTDDDSVQSDAVISMLPDVVMSTKVARLVVDAGSSGEVDAGPVSEVDAEPIVGVDAGPIVRVDSGPIVGVDAGPIVGVDSGPIVGVDAGPSGEVDAGAIMGVDAGPMMGVDAGPIVGVDAGPIMGVDAGPIVGMNAEPVGGGGPMLELDYSVAVVAEDMVATSLDYVIPVRVDGDLELLDTVEQAARSHRTWSDLGYSLPAAIESGNTTVPHEAEFKPQLSPLQHALSMPELNRSTVSPQRFDNLSSDAATRPSPQPRNLMKYLQNQDLATCADIDKENAHFHFSEILISTIEQLKCSLATHHHPLPSTATHHHPPPSQPDLSTLQDMTSSSDRSSTSSLLSPDVIRCRFPTSPQTPTKSSPADFSSINDVIITSSSSRSGFSTSRSSTEDSVGVGRSEVQLPSSQLPSSPRGRRSNSFRTAESIAIGLLQTFSGTKSPDHVTWLISEDDVPQKLLPMPDAVVVDPDGVEIVSDWSKSLTQPTNDVVRIRGNHEWAPPRPQIIFKLPQRLKLKAAIARQNERCAGCGTIIGRGFLKRLRYCEYIGKYFCTCCHDNKQAVIPARVLERFDLHRYKVSNFSFDLLQRIEGDPLFNVADINPALYKKTKSLATVRKLRLQLAALHRYMKSCRFANQQADDQPSWNEVTARNFDPHMLEDDVDLYSISDFHRCKNFTNFAANLQSAIDFASAHLKGCELCKMKGFICEFCNLSTDVIFPHNPNTATCERCKACYHSTCFVPERCPKCKRAEKRKELLRGSNQLQD